MKKNIVKITFESNDTPENHKCVLEIVDDTKLTINFIPEISKDAKYEYSKYLGCLMDVLTKN